MEALVQGHSPGGEYGFFRRLKSDRGFRRDPAGDLARLTCPNVALRVYRAAFDDDLICDSGSGGAGEGGEFGEWFPRVKTGFG